MNKDKAILEFLERLKLLFDFTLVEVVDNWESDLCAFGLQRRDKLVYISTYNFMDEAILKYDYDLEILDRLNVTKIEVLKEGRGVTEDQLIDEIKMFLEI